MCRHIVHVGTRIGVFNFAPILLWRVGTTACIKGLTCDAFLKRCECQHAPSDGCLGVAIPLQRFRGNQVCTEDANKALRDAWVCHQRYGADA